MLVWRPLVTGSSQVAMCLGTFSLSKYPVVMPPATTKGCYPDVALPYTGIAEWSVKPDMVLKSTIALQKIFHVSWSNVPTGTSVYFATKPLLSAEQQLIGRVKRAEAVCMHAAWEKSAYRDLNSL